jgi:hypothetical protein
VKRIVLFLSLLAAFGGLCFAQQSIFVSAAGSDENSGRSENSPYMTMQKALVEVRSSGINRITIIGVLDAESQIVTGNVSVFTIALPVGANELLITGIRGVRSALSGRGSGLPVLAATGAETRIRLENIEIINGEGEEGSGLLVLKGSSVTLGQGTVVRQNQTGVKLAEGACIIDGGEVRDNSLTGIMISDNCTLTMRNGVILNNKNRGVVVQKGGRFSMLSGSITGNYTSTAGGGVYAAAGARFDQTAGDIIGNMAPQFPDVYREQGAFGNDLSMTVPVSSNNDPGNGTKTSSAGIGFHLPLFIGLYGQGWRENLFSLGASLQLGFEVEFSNVFCIALLGEADGGLGYPYILEGDLLGAAEIYFAGKKIGFSGGYGTYRRVIQFHDTFASDGSIEIAADQEVLESNFYRFSLIFRGPVKTAVYVNRYDRGRWDDFGNWGFGIQFSKSLL